MVFKLQLETVLTMIAMLIISPIFLLGTLFSAIVGETLAKQSPKVPGWQVLLVGMELLLVPIVVWFHFSSVELIHFAGVASGVANLVLFAFSNSWTEMIQEKRPPNG